VQCGHILSAAQERALGYRVTTLGALHASAGPQPAQCPHRTTRSNARRQTRTRRRGALRSAPPCEDIRRVSASAPDEKPRAP
jgi:hypothetical protein